MEVQQQIQALLQTSDPAKAQRYHQEVGLNLLLSARCAWTLTEGMPCTYRLPRHTLEMQWKCAPLLNPWARACLLERRAQVILLASTLTWQPRFILGPTGDQCHCAAGVSGRFNIVAGAATCGRAGHREQGAVLGLQPLLQVSWQH